MKSQPDWAERVLLGGLYIFFSLSTIRVWREMPDASEMEAPDAPEPERGQGSPGTVLAPGVLLRLQYASYLFIGLVLCLLLKGSAGRAFDSVGVLRSGCELLVGSPPQQQQQPSSSGGVLPPLLPTPPTLSSPVPFREGGGGSESVLLNAVCYSNTLVYRVSFALVLFFLVHFASVSDLTCCIDASSRAQFQQRFFFVKSAVLLLLFSASFSIPNAFFAGYAWLCLLVSAVFLIVQMILMVDFSYQWNDDWGQRAEDNSKWQWYLLTVSLGSYGVGLAICVAGYMYLVLHGDCNFNAFAITAVLVFGLVSTVIAIWVPHGSIVPSGIVFAYCAILQFANLRNDSSDVYCNAFAGTATSLKSTVLAAIFSGSVLAYSVISAGGSRSSLFLSSDGDYAPVDDADVSGHLSEYCFFHAIMMAGSMYLAMLASDWTVSGGSSSASSSTSVAFWVKNASIWCTMFLYLWTLLAPYFCCKDRDFGFQTDDW